ncbi:Chaperone protein DnaJ [Diplonema papillatum]|nr:Chaperone protein DnaJ [Diplonema papillatum]
MHRLLFRWRPVQSQSVGLVARRWQSIDPYKVLGVRNTADQSEIKSAYRKLAKKWHPDLNQQDRAKAEQKFKEVSEAYQLVSDPQKKQQYDAFGSAAGGNPFAGMRGTGGFNQSPEAMETLFKDMFGKNVDVANVFRDLEQAVAKGKVKQGSHGGPGAFYSVNVSDLFGKGAAGGGFGGFGFAGGFPGGGAGAGGTQTMQQVVVKPDGSRVMRTTTVTFDKDGKPHQSVTENAV